MTRLLFILLFASLTAFSAFVAIKVPFLTWGMPKSLPGAEAIAQWKGLVFGSHTISAQLLLVWLAGALLGARRGAVAMAIFLAVGLSGVPIFSNGGGWDYLGEPTFGYLLAFLPAVVIVGLLAQDPRFGRTWLGMGLGLLLVQSVGLVYELIVRGQFTSLGAWWQLGQVQVFQFLPGQVALMTCVAFVVAMARKADAAYLAWRAERLGDDEDPVLPEATPDPTAS